MKFSTLLLLLATASVARAKSPSDDQMREVRAVAKEGSTSISAPVKMISQRPIVLTGATIVDVKSGQSRPDMTIVVVGNRIAALGKAGKVDIPTDGEVIDASGKYLLPGFLDMHVHLPLESASKIDMPLMVANGVTGIREMASDCPPARDQDCLGQMRNWQRQIETGELVGPRLLSLSSWPVRGPRGLNPDAPAFFGAANATQSRQLARYFADRKVDFIKIRIFSDVPRDAYLALVDEARKLGLGVAGHEPPNFSAIEASDAGQQSVEHARVFLFNCFPDAAEFQRQNTVHHPSTAWRRRMVDGYDPKTCRRMFRTFARNKTRYVPTHLTRKMDAFADNPAFRHDSRAKYIPKAQWKNWNEDADRMIALDSSPQGRKAMMDFYLKGLEITGAAYRAGVKVMLGTDSTDSYVFPGFAVHDELEELVTAGLTPAEALKTATWNGAEFLGRTSDSGSIEKGKRADLVLLEADPLTDIRNSRKIDAVVLNGRYLDRSALDLLLRGVEAAAAGPFSE